VYIGHRKFLSRLPKRRPHLYRKMTKKFNEKIENERAPVPLTGVQMFKKLKDKKVEFGKRKQKKSKEEKQKEKEEIWKKRSIFRDLDYWRDLDVRHCLDGMHIIKNIFVNLYGTLLNILGKNKRRYQSKTRYGRNGYAARASPCRRGW
jgi:hypothetical protein